MSDPETSENPLTSADLDMEHLQSWVGSTESVTDQVTDSLIDRFCATFYDKLWPMEGGVPLGLHWCLAPPAAPGDLLGADGHPKRGGFLPPVPLPSRMWAGGELLFHDLFRAGDKVSRCSEVKNVVLKEGSSGPLVFVTLEHLCSVGDRLIITERQDLVYKNANPKQAELAGAQADPVGGETRQSGSHAVNSVDLFRYSALTFNGHRIHYDRDYACGEEGYPGLVVHGPFQTTLLMNRAAELCGGVPARFSFRGVAPLIEGVDFQIKEALDGDGGALWCETTGGKRTMKAEYARG